MSTAWMDRLLIRLEQSVNPDGGWGYRPDTVSSAEPTALTCLALIARGRPKECWLPGLNWLASLQRDDGSVPIQPDPAFPCWPTPLAVMAWMSARLESQGAFDRAIRSAVDWLLHTRGKKLRPRPEMLGHDTTLQGWPWVQDTHSWVEPTAYAILALRAAGLNHHARVREGIRLLWDRALPDGGWNYGNKRVLGTDLRPFPGPTGIALTALAGEPWRPIVRSSIAYLTRELDRIRAPITVAWGLIGLTGWNHRPVETDRYLEECGNRSFSTATASVDDALLLLAAEDHPLTILTTRKDHGS